MYQHHPIAHLSSYQTRCGVWQFLVAHPLPLHCWWYLSPTIGCYSYWRSCATYYLALYLQLKYRLQRISWIYPLSPISLNLCLSSLLRLDIGLSFLLRKEPPKLGLHHRCNSELRPVESLDFGHEHSCQRLYALPDSCSTVRL